jgi:hypothetical protein
MLYYRQTPVNFYLYLHLVVIFLSALVSLGTSESAIDERYLLCDRKQMKRMRKKHIV